MATLVSPQQVQESLPSHLRAVLQDNLYSQPAERLEALLPMLFLRLFALDPDHPAAELSPVQLRVCTVLHRGPCSMCHLSVDVGVKFSSMTRIADRLERDGLVERVLAPEDRRMRVLQLSPYGMQIMDSRKRFRLKRAEEALGYLEEPVRQEILQAFRTLLSAASELPTVRHITDTMRCQPATCDP